MSSKKCRIILFLLICVLPIGCTSTSKTTSRVPAQISISDLGEYTGSSEFKLFFGSESGSKFIPNINLLQTSEESRVRQEVRNTVKKSFLISTLPLLGSISGLRTGTEKSLFESLIHSASIIRENLRNDLSEIEKNHAHIDIWPYKQSLFLAPIKEERKDLFYSAEKVSAGSLDVSQIIGTTPSNNRFPAKITESIKLLQSKTHLKTPDQAYLLAMHSQLIVDPKGESQLLIKALLGIHPMTIPFEEKNDQVHIKQIDIPNKATDYPVVALDIIIGLSPQSEEPQLLLSFGEFTEYKDNKFILSNKPTTAPCLKGSVAKVPLQVVAIDFCFKDMQFDLNSLSLNNLNILTSPGLSLGKHRFTFGGLQISSVSTQLQNEINNSIKTQIEAAKEKVEKKKDDSFQKVKLEIENLNIVNAGQLSSSTVDLALKKILGVRN